jgi:hypothetical protein
VLPADTSAAAQAAQQRWLARLTPSQKVELAVKMSEDVRAIARSGIAARHPDYSPQDVEFALLRLLYGTDLFCRAWPRAPVLEP